MDEHSPDCAYFMADGTYPQCDCELKMEFPPDPFIAVVLNIVNSLNQEGA